MLCLHGLEGSRRGFVLKNVEDTYLCHNIILMYMHLKVGMEKLQQSLLIGLFKTIASEE
jgi:hypothetical protein